MKHRLFVFAAAGVLAGVLARPSHAQGSSEVARVQSAVVGALRAESPRVPLLLVHEASRASEAQAIGRLTGIRAVERPATGKVQAAGADTVSIHLSVETIGVDTAVVTVDRWGSLSSKSKGGPTTWWTQQRAHLVRRGSTWVVSKLTTLMES